MAVRKIAARDFEIEILSKGSPLVVLFEADWCSFCARFRGILERRIDEIEMPLIDVLLDDYDDVLWDRYSIEAVPTVAVFEKGEVVFRIDGPLGTGLDDSDLTRLVDYIRTRAPES